MYGYNETMKLSQYLALPGDKKREYENEIFKGMSTPPDVHNNKFSKNINGYTKDLPCLYCQIAFPNYQNKDGTFRFSFHK